MQREGLDCDFDRLDGYLFLAPDTEEALLDEELAAAHRAELSEVKKVRRAPLASFNAGRCLRFPEQAQFHPLKYLSGLDQGDSTRRGERSSLTTTSIRSTAVGRLNYRLRRRSHLVRLHRRRTQAC